LTDAIHGVFLIVYFVAGDLNMIKIKNQLRVAISGKSGCGNTTVSTLLSEKLGVTMINYTFRQLAAEKGLTLAQVIENAKTDDSYDEYVDSHQVELARKENCVLGSRLAIWMLKEADFKVYLYASDETRAGRVFNREGGNLEEIKRFTAMRDSEDSRRYLKLYSIDNNKYDFADLIIDTADYNPDQIVEPILTELAKRGLIER
jgi:cytidylate kinase